MRRLVQTVAASLTLIATATPGLANKPINVVMSLHRSGGALPVFTGQTNLPDGMQLMFTVFDAGGQISGQADATVQHGSFQAGPFSDHDAPYNVGNYVVEVTSSAGQFEPADIQKIIGDQGQWLRGAAVIDEATGFGRTIDYKEGFQIAH